MTGPQIEIELDGARQPLPGTLKRLSIEDDWVWSRTRDGGVALYRRERAVQIELWGTIVELDRYFARQAYIRCWVTQPGCQPVAATLQTSLRVLGPNPNDNWVELRGQAEARDFAQEAPHAG
jgi:hypothetical protein